MTTLYLVRHGETTWNRERRIQGHRDPPLNETGRWQAQALAEHLAGVCFDAAYASDLCRARHTAEIILLRHNLPIETRTELRERFLGRWEGLLIDDLPVVDSEAWQVWLTRPRNYAPHGGETEVDLERRAVGAISSIANAHPFGTVLVVSHGGTIRATLNGWLGVDTHHTPNCGAYVIEATPTERKLVDEIRLP